jgi:GntR family transcriptional regulator, rspAB operon transcriptional repressor
MPLFDIYSVIFDKIIDGEYPPNTRLKEEVLSEEFKISRTPIRAVLVQLEQDGLIQITANKGASVLPFTADEIEEIYEIRKVLELLCLEISAPILSMQKLLELKKEMLNSVDDQDIKIHSELDAKLHNYIIVSTGKKRLINNLGQLFRLIQRFRSLGFMQKDTKESTIREHIEILNAICMRNTVIAKELMMKHIDNSKIIALEQLFKK